MSTFAFFTRFFVLLIISHSVIFYAGGQDDTGNVGNVTNHGPSINLSEQCVATGQAVNGFILTVEGTAMVRGAGALHRVNSGMILAVLKNMDSNSIQAGWSFFCEVRKMKDDYAERVKELRSAIEDCSHQALRREFNWGSQLVVPDPPESPESSYAKKNGIGKEFLRLLGVRALIDNNAAAMYLNSGVDLPNFTSKLDSTIKYCQDLMKEIKDLENKLSGMPVSPLGSSNPKPWPGSNSLDDF